MGMEIERRFLLKNSFEWKPHATSCRDICQIYLSHDPVVRLRILGKFDQDGCKAFLTIKGRPKYAAGRQVGKPEFEYEIPESDAKEMIFSNLSVSNPIMKKRYLVPHEGLTWELDEFSGLNEGLLIAEVELESMDQEIQLPSWVGEEITDDHRYANSSLSKHPIKDW